MFTTYMSRSNIAQYKRVFDAALSKVDKNSMYGKRLLKEYASLLYAELESDMWDMSKGKRLNANEKKIYEQRIENWRNKIKQTSVGVLSESGISVDDYYQHYTRAIKTLSGNN
jgi:hypothetical protein